MVVANIFPQLKLTAEMLSVIFSPEQKPNNGNLKKDIRFINKSN